MNGLYVWLGTMFGFWFWVAVLFTPVAIYLNIMKERIEAPALKRKYKKWGMITLLLGPGSLLVILPVISFMRLLSFNATI